MPRTPKPPAQRRRRNKPEPQTKVERKTAYPDPPKNLTPAGRAWWRRVWKSPVAGGWTDADRPVVERLAKIVSALSIDRDIHTSARRQLVTLSENTGVELDALEAVLRQFAGLAPTLMSEARQLEDRLGLTPLSRRRLGWDIDEPDQAGLAEQPPATVIPGRFLKAMEGGLS